MLGGAGILPSTVCHSSDLNLPCFRTELVILWCIIVGLRNYLIICKNNITEKLLEDFEGLLKLPLESAGFLSVRFSNVWSFIDPSHGEPIHGFARSIFPLKSPESCNPKISRNGVCEKTHCVVAFCLANTPFLGYGLLPLPRLWALWPVDNYS